MNKISIIIPILNEERYIKNCIDSILDSNYDKESMEILLIDGGSNDKTIEIISGYKNNNIKLFNNPEKIAPVAMNIGIKESSGDFLFIISAHAKYEKDYFSALVNYIKKLNANCVGGVLYTEVKNINKKSNSIKEILTHKFGVGDASFRVGSAKIKEVDTVAFGCYTKETFETYGVFNEKLTRNQDIELNKRIINNGGKIFLIPTVRCTYYARENFTDLAKNNYANGYWNILTAYYTKTFNALSLRHFIPLLFVLSILLPFIFSFVFPKLLWIVFFSLSSYITFVIIASIKIKKKTNSFLYLVQSFITLHFSYGFGSFIGIFSVVKKFFKGRK